MPAKKKDPSEPEKEFRPTIKVKDFVHVSHSSFENPYGAFVKTEKPEPTTNSNGKKNANDNPPADPSSGKAEILLNISKRMKDDGSVKEYDPSSGPSSGNEPAIKPNQVTITTKIVLKSMPLGNVRDLSKNFDGNSTDNCQKTTFETLLMKKSDIKMVKSSELSKGCIEETVTKTSTTIMVNDPKKATMVSDTKESTKAAPPKK